MVRRSHNDPGHAHFLTFSCYHRRQFLTNTHVCAWLTESIELARRQHDFSLWAYVFMPEHAHLLIHPRRADYFMSEILRDTKAPVAKRWVANLRKTAPKRLALMKARQGRREVHRLWQAGGGYDRNLFNWDTIEMTVDYIEWNPVTRGFVGDPKDWVWSSARARAGEEDVQLRIDEFVVSASPMVSALSKPLALSEAEWVTEKAPSGPPATMVTERCNLRIRASYEW